MQQASDPPPWRVIESATGVGAPPAGAASAGARGADPTGPAGSSPAPGIVVEPRVLATIAATIACAAIAFALAFGSGAGPTVIEGGTALDPAPDGSATIGGAAGGDVVVEIVGAVARPGVYHLAPGARLVDLLEAAGGYGPRVDTARAERDLNLAATLRDGDRIRVPSRGDEVATGGPSANPGSAGVDGGSTSGGTALISLNTATSAELDTLPGIGPATAAKIIAAREEAPFAAVEDLRTRGVVGEKTFEKLRDLVTP